jgi:hypothetical protein
MRFYELQSGLRLPVSNEENKFVEKLKEEGSLLEDKLDEREVELARKLCSRGVIDRFETETQYGYKIKPSFNLRD